MARTDPQLSIRLTEDLKKQVSDASIAAGRSMNAEIVQRLEASFHAVLESGPERADEQIKMLTELSHKYAATVKVLLEEMDDLRKAEAKRLGKPSEK